MEERFEPHDFGQNNHQAAKANFASGVDRFEAGDPNAPGPGHYTSVNDPNYIIRGPAKVSFGSNLPRNTLIFRDVSRSPFKNPTSLENPAPSTYAPKNHETSLISKDRKGRNSQSIILTENSVELIEQSEIKLDPNFTSSVPRDFLASVSKEIRQNPGPGSYLKD